MGDIVPKRWAFSLISILMALPAQAAESERVLFEDSFQGRLQPGWQWKEDASGDRRVRDGVLHLRSRPGGLWRQGNDVRNLVLRPLTIPEGKTAAVEVRVSNQPGAPYENAGLVLYFDDDHYVGLIKEFMGGDLVVAMSREVAAEGNVPARQPFKATHIWLRLEVSEKEVSSFYRPSEKDAWRPLGTCQRPHLGPAQIGLLASYGHADLEHWVQFRGFRILQLESRP